MYYFPLLSLPSVPLNILLHEIDHSVQLSLKSGSLGITSSWNLVDNIIPSDLICWIFQGYSFIHCRRKGDGDWFLLHPNSSINSTDTLTLCVIDKKVASVGINQWWGIQVRTSNPLIHHPSIFLEIFNPFFSHPFCQPFPDLVLLHPFDEILTYSCSVKDFELKSWFVCFVIIPAHLCPSLRLQKSFNSQFTNLYTIQSWMLVSQLPNTWTSSFSFYFDDLLYHHHLITTTTPISSSL